MSRIMVHSDYLLFVPPEYCYHIYSHINWWFSAEFLRQSFGGRLIRGSCHTLTVSTQHDVYDYWPLGLRVCVGACAASSGTTHRLLWLRISQVGHSNLAPIKTMKCARRTCCSGCCELVDTHALSTHRSTVLVRRQFTLPAHTQVSNFCQIFSSGNGVDLYVSIYGA